MSTVPALLFALATAAAPTSRGEILDFSGQHCPPCQQMVPLVARLEREGLPIRYVDTAREPELTQRFDIQLTPTFVLVIDGREADRHVGTMTESQLRAWAQRIPREAAEPAPGAPAATRLGATPFVADPNVRLGTPGSLNAAFASDATDPAVDAQRAAPQRTQLAAADAAPQRSQAAAADSPPKRGIWPFGRREQEQQPEESPEIRASDAPLIEERPAPSPPMAASVRLRVTVNGQINLGSGTIIESAPGKSRIVTCGHIFRGFAEGSRIEVNLFADGREQTLNGDLVSFDLEADVGLIEVACDQVLPTVRVARDVQAARAQENVQSIGCSGGAPPTLENIVVTAVNPYLGPDNLECTGVPVQGRSGGGLFRSSGELVGICIAADPQRQRGVYAGLLAVHNILQKAGLAHLYQTPAPAEQPAAVALAGFDRPAAAPAATTDPRIAATTAAPVGGAESAPGSLFDSLTPAVSAPRPEAPATQPAADYPVDFNRTGGSPVALNAAHEDAEIVCIIRPRNQPESASQIVVIHQASPKMLSYLRGELGSSNMDAAMLSRTQDEARRSRNSSIPTMGTSIRGGDDAVPAATTPATPAWSFKPALEPTSLMQPVSPRRYVRSR